MLVDPLYALGNDAAVRGRLLQVGNLLVLPVQAQEVVSVVGGAITDHYLGRILVGHHDSGRGQLTALCVRVVGSEWLSSHTHVVMGTLAVGRTNKFFNNSEALTETS